VGVSFDITARKRAEAELLQANRDLEQFAYSASHDLREPLRNVRIFTQLLESRYRDKFDGEALDFLNQVSSGAARMDDLVRDILLYARTSQLDPPHEPVDASPPLEAALENLRTAVAESGAAIERGSMPTLRVHVAHLQQLFQNLIGNAIKYRRPDVTPQIRVGAGPENGFWKFSVQDNGIGIQPEYQERIFGMFKRLHAAAQYSGTGIGLALCERIVNRYNGRIWVESAEGQGSIFYFTLPV
jgi:light-regulated signal transduction histidine kinase (bacteriophytochrome)